MAESIARAVATLQAGGLIVYPTDTIYGIGADPHQPAALERLQSAKQRLEQKPILLIAHSIDAARTVVDHFPPTAMTLAGALWPGPLTLVLPARAALSPMITQNSGTVGVRLPSHAFCARLAECFGRPFTSTSANISGLPTPDTVDAIEAMLGDSIDFYLDAGRLPASKPSTVVDVTTDPPRILREGAVSRGQLLALVPELR